MTDRQQAVEFVEKWAHDLLNAKRKGPTETHRWLLCWNGTGDGTDDCACCILPNLDPQFAGVRGCICHERVASLADLLIRYAQLHTRRRLQ